MRVLGLDLSLTSTGIATGAGATLAIKTKSADGDLRLEVIYEAILDAAKGADLAVLEDLPYSARQAGVTGMVQGVARLALMRQNVPYAFLSPATLKVFATRMGKATKADMAHSLWLTYGIDLRHPKDKYNDQVDAMWLRIAGRHRLGLDHTLDERAHRLDTGKWQNWSYSI